MTLAERIRQLPPEKQAMVEDFIGHLLNQDAPKKPAMADPKQLIDLFGTIAYDPHHDYKAARTRGVKEL